MLVLTRKLQEKIVIGGDVVVTILRIKGNQVRIGIEAPREVRILRGELPGDSGIGTQDTSDFPPGIGDGSDCWEATGGPSE